MTNAFIFNIMLINKYLTNLNYIFPKNTDPLYLRSLVALGSYPIFVYIKNNIRIISIGIKYNLNEGYQEYFTQYLPCVTLDNFHLFNFDCCNRSEIKEVLFRIKEINSYFNVPLMFQFKYIYFLDVSK